MLSIFLILESSSLEDPFSVWTEYQTGQEDAFLKNHADWCSGQGLKYLNFANE